MSQVSLRCPLAVLVAATLLAPRQASPQLPDSEEILASEDARFAAMVRADTESLRDALADDLSYVHTSARSETKAQYLELSGGATAGASWFGRRLGFRRSVG